MGQPRVFNCGVDIPKTSKPGFLSVKDFSYKKLFLGRTKSLNTAYRIGELFMGQDHNALTFVTSVPLDRGFLIRRENSS